MAGPRPRPAFYAADRGRLGDWWTLLHPPYTAWHLGHVLIGAGLAPRIEPVNLAATLLAFLFAVGISAHALDELQGRPLRTAIGRRTLWVVAIGALVAAAGIGVAGIGRVGWPLAVLIIVGVFLVLAYNLEWFGGAIHTDLGFALAWGAFPTVTAYLAQTGRVDGRVLLAAAATTALSKAQRSLSTPVRRLRRRTAVCHVHLETHDGEVVDGGAELLLAPAERALRALALAVVALGSAMVLARLL